METCFVCRGKVVSGVVIHRACLASTELDEARLRAENERLRSEAAAWQDQAGSLQERLTELEGRVEMLRRQLLFGPGV